MFLRGIAIAPLRGTAATTLAVLPDTGVAVVAVAVAVAVDVVVVAAVVTVVDVFILANLLVFPKSCNRSD